jgi:hypothetical protein
VNGAITYGCDTLLPDFIWTGHPSWNQIYMLISENESFENCESEGVDQRAEDASRQSPEPLCSTHCNSTTSSNKSGQSNADWANSSLEIDIEDCGVPPEASAPDEDEPLPIRPMIEKSNDPFKEPDLTIILDGQQLNYVSAQDHFWRLDETTKLQTWLCETIYEKSGHLFKMLRVQPGFQLEDSDLPVEVDAPIVAMHDNTTTSTCEKQTQTEQETSIDELEPVDSEKSQLQEQQSGGKESGVQGPALLATPRRVKQKSESGSVRESSRALKTRGGAYKQRQKHWSSVTPPSNPFVDHDTTNRQVFRGSGRGRRRHWQVMQQPDNVEFVPHGPRRPRRSFDGRLPGTNLRSAPGQSLRSRNLYQSLNQQAGYFEIDDSFSNSPPSPRSQQRFRQQQWHDDQDYYYYRDVASDGYEATTPTKSRGRGHGRGRLNTNYVTYHGNRNQRQIYQSHY